MRHISPYLMAIFFALATLLSALGLRKKFTAAHFVESLCFTVVFAADVALLITLDERVFRVFRYSLLAAAVVFFVHRFVLNGQYAAALEARESAKRNGSGPVSAQK